MVSHQPLRQSEAGTVTTSTIRAALDAFQQAANRGTAVHLSPELVQELRDALKTEPETPSETLAARPLLEQVAAMADRIGHTTGEIVAITSRAKAWLSENPPGQPVAIKPRGCPMPGACSCVEPAPPAPEPGEVGELVELLKLAGRWATSTGVHLNRFAALFAALFDQQATELAALREVPVPVSERLPEPNTKVLAHYFNKLGKGRTVCAIWVPAKTRVSDNDIDEDLEFEYDDETDQFYWPEGWYEAIENWEEFGYLKVYEGEVAYWQPLPKWPANALPAPQAGEGKA